MFTYKRQSPTGKYRSFEPQDNHEIKLKRKVVGHIYETKAYSHIFRIHLAVKKEPTEKEPAPFRWATLKAEFSSSGDAKTFLENHFEEIIEKFDLHSFED